MIVVFDSNIWIKHLYLRAPAGAATRFFIKEKKARVALPEVVRLEVEHHLRDDLREYISKIKDNHKRLLAIFGTLKQIVLPCEHDVEQKVSEAFASLGVNIIEVPFCLESARDSFLRTVTKKPPSHRTQQFKDGVLWADCVSLLKNDDVVLVTEDKDFYQGNDYSKGLADTLHREIASFDRNLTLFARLPQLLEEIQCDVTIDHDGLAAAFLEKSHKSTQGLLQRFGFQLAERTGLLADLFVTEKPEVLFLEFKITFRCIDISGAERGDGSLDLRGDGFYNSATRIFSGLGELGEELHFPGVDGSEQVVRNVVVRVGGIVLGHSNVSHTIRKKLD